MTHAADLLDLSVLNGQLVILIVLIALVVGDGRRSGLILLQHLLDKFICAALGFFFRYWLLFGFSVATCAALCRHLSAASLAS